MMERWTESVRNACGAYCEGLEEVKIVTGGNWVEMYGKGGGGRKDGKVVECDDKTGQP